MQEPTENCLLYRIVSRKYAHGRWTQVAAQRRRVDPTAPRLYPLQLLLPDCVCFSLLLPDCVLFSCCYSSASACYHAHAVQSIISPHIHYRFHHSACCYIIWFVRGRTCEKYIDPLQSCSKNGGWAYFRGCARDYGRYHEVKHSCKSMPLFKFSHIHECVRALYTAL